MRNENIFTVWEVYEENSQRCIVFKSKYLAESQSVFNSVDLIAKAQVFIADCDLKDFANGVPVWA